MSPPSSSSSEFEENNVSTQPPKFGDETQNNNRQSRTSEFGRSAQYGRRGFDTMRQWVIFVQASESNGRGLQKSSKEQLREVDQSYEPDLDQVKPHRTAQESLKQFYKQSATAATAGPQTDAHRSNSTKNLPVGDQRTTWRDV